MVVNCLAAWCFVLMCGWVRGQDEAEPSWYRELLRSARTVAESPEAGLAKAEVRRQVGKLSRQTPAYGLALLDPLNAATDRVVVFVHGYNSRPEALRYLIELMRRQGHAVAVFRYPNDEPLEESARRFASALAEFRQKHPQPSLILLTHSMGGLVARRVIEDPGLAPGDVTRLIMIAPPNHGSALARGSRGMDVAEYVLSAARRQESGPIAGAFLDGLAEAGLDLRPDSEFLRALNARPRNPHVKYTIFAGSGAPLRSQALDVAQHWLNRAANESPYARITFEELDVRVDDLEELVRGKGDGAVSLASARLDGVDDFVVGDFSHLEILLPGRSAEIRRIQRAIVDRVGGKP